MDIWNWDYAWEVFPSLVRALVTQTIPVTLLAFLMAVVVGLVFALLRRSKVWFISKPAGIVVDFIRFTPLLVQAFFLFFFSPISMSVFTTGVVALGLHYSTYMAEVYRSGIDGVDKGQWEAATALNFTTTQKWSKIILPQAIPPIIPVMGNYLIIMFKETPILLAISLTEMLGVARSYGSGVFSYTEGFIIVGFLFLVVSYPCSLIFRKLELRLNQQRGK